MLSQQAGLPALWDEGRNQPSALPGGKDDHDLTRQDRLGSDLRLQPPVQSRRFDMEHRSRIASVGTESRPLLSVQQVPLAIQQAPLLFQRPFSLQRIHPPVKLVLLLPYVLCRPL